MRKRRAVGWLLTHLTDYTALRPTALLYREFAHNASNICIKHKTFAQAGRKQYFAGISKHIWRLSGKIARISSRAGNLSPDFCSGWQATATVELCPCSAPAHTPLLAPFAFVYRGVQRLQHIDENDPRQASRHSPRQGHFTIQLATTELGDFGYWVVGRLKGAGETV